MVLTQEEVLEFVQENDVKFIKLTFLSLPGTLKNINIMAPQLPEAFERGICVDNTAVDGFPESGDVFLFPDPTTLSILPWRPSHGRVIRLFCHLKHADGAPCAEDGRYLLRQTVRKAAQMGYQIRIGCECEFYLFQLDDAGMPTLIPQDAAGYCDAAPLDKGENVRREICLSLEDMGISAESSHHERGPGQNEVVLRHTDPLAAADAFANMRSVSQVIAAQNGLHASFLPKPLPDKNGSSLHINLSLNRDGVNLFKTQENAFSSEAESFLAGILHRYIEITPFLNPLPDSYLRFGSDVYDTLTWSHQNRQQLVRIPAAGGAYSRMELRSPDPTINPYLAFTLLLEAGLEGIREKRSLPAPSAQDAPPLPTGIGQAVELARQSSFVADILTADVVERYCSTR